MPYNRGNGQEGWARRSAAGAKAAAPAGRVGRRGAGAGVRQYAQQPADARPPSSASIPTSRWWRGRASSTWSRRRRPIACLPKPAQHPHQAAAVLARAKDFREALNGLASAIDAGRQPGADVLETIGECLAGAYANGRLVPHEGALQWVASAEDDLDRVLWEIGRAAGRLVVSPRLARVRACAASDCGWWFVDDTKNRSRRWCDMKLCGNREKLRRFRSQQNKVPACSRGSRWFQRHRSVGSNRSRRTRNRVRTMPLTIWSIGSLRPTVSCAPRNNERARL